MATPKKKWEAAYKIADREYLQETGWTTDQEDSWSHPTYGSDYSLGDAVSIQVDADNGLIKNAGK